MRLDYDVDGLAALLLAVETGGWETVELRAAFRAVPGPGEFSPIVPDPGVVIWTPPERAFVRGLVGVVDLGDPLVAAGGALNVSAGTQQVTAGTYVASLITAQATAVWNTAGGRVLGWGAQGPGFTGTAPGVQEAGVAVWPANQMWPGETQDARALAVACNLGSYTGTILFTFQWRPF